MKLSAILAVSEKVGVDLVLAILRVVGRVWIKDSFEVFGERKKLTAVAVEFETNRPAVLAGPINRCAMNPALGLW